MIIITDRPQQIPCAIKCTWKIRPLLNIFEKFQSEIKFKRCIWGFNLTNFWAQSWSTTATRTEQRTGESPQCLLFFWFRRNLRVFRPFKTQTIDRGCVCGFEVSHQSFLSVVCHGWQPESLDGRGCLTQCCLCCWRCLFKLISQTDLPPLPSPTQLRRLFQLETTDCSVIGGGKKHPDLYNRLETPSSPQTVGAPCFSL